MQHKNFKDVFFSFYVPSYFPDSACPNNVVLHTDDTADTTYQDTGLNMSLYEAVVFHVKACKHAYVLLSQDADYQNGELYQILIGGSSNTKSALWLAMITIY